MESPFGSMLAVAHIIDEGLKKIEESVSSAKLSMMPSEECQPLSEEILKGLADEAKQLQEATEAAKIKMFSMKETVKAERESLSEKVQKMNYDLDNFENMLEKFGYVRFQMPEDKCALEEELSNVVDNSVISSESDEEPTKSEANLEAEDSVESTLEEDGVTPFIFKSRKSSRSSNKSHLSAGSEQGAPYPSSIQGGTRKLVFEPSPIPSYSVAPSSLNKMTPAVRLLKEKPMKLPLSKISAELLGLSLND